MKETRRAPNQVAATAGRAELLRALASQGDAGLAAMAGLLGYERRELPPDVPAPRPGATRKEAAPKFAPFPGVLAPIPFFLPTADRFLTPEPPAERQKVELIGPGGLGETHGTAPRQLPLVSESRVTPVLRPRLAATAPSRRVDVQVLARRWSRKEVVTEIPREPLVAWARRLTVIVDRSLHLLPFWDDQEDFLRLLARRFGREALCVVGFHEGGLDPWEDGRGSYAEPPLEPGVPVLALSDLGFLGKGRSRWVWENLGRKWAQRGVPRVALVPCAPRFWEPAVARLWSAVDAEQPKRRTPPGVPLEEAERRARAEQLLVPLAFAANIDPTLLRAIRRLLPAEDFDPGVEADAWGHPEVDGGFAPVAGLGPELRRRLQARFGSLPEDIRTSAVEALRHHRAGQSREVWLDEVSALAAGGALPEGTLLLEELAESRKTWNRIATTLESPAATPRVKEALRSYTRSALAARQPEAIWEDAELRPVLARAWKAAWADETANPPLVPGMGPEDLGPSDAEPVRWQVWQVGATLRFTSAPLSAGSFVCEVESANGQVVLFANGQRAPAPPRTQPQGAPPPPPPR
ncbi:MAG: hypothetical protein SF066_15465 [Thermoanaerobaculia bacterium]|nr:hypothetical protein [Thermoanaerobaculia bacterium]